MTGAILGWQLLIFLSIIISGRYKWVVAIFWVVWTIGQINMLPLSAIQFFTIGIALLLSKN